MRNPLVSIVTPSYNQGRFIRATIESVLGQDYPNLEYIVMDGGSGDETRAVVKDYASRLTFVSEKDCGQSHAINKGFRAARGSILFWLNSDDVILPGAVRSAVDEFARNPAAGAVYGEGYLMDIDGAVTSRFTATEPFNLWKLVYLSDYILQQTLYVRREVLDDIGDLDETLRFTMDWDLLIRIGLRYPLSYIRRPMGCLREYPEAKSFSGGRRRIREMRKMLQRHTGMRVPPAIVTYGLNTYQQIWCAEIGRVAGSRLKPLAGVLQSLVRFCAGLVIDSTHYYSQGLYSDGWAAPIMRLMLPPGSGPLVIEGHVPAESSWLRGQALRIVVNGQALESRHPGAGDFCLKFDLPAGLQDQLLRINVNASRWILPRTLGIGGDFRRLAFQFKSIRNHPPVQHRFPPEPL
jgi:hypothetical protein